MINADSSSSSCEPRNLAHIEMVASLGLGLAQVACLDTAVHRTSPEFQPSFALPYLSPQDGIQPLKSHLRIHRLGFATVPTQHGSPREMSERGSEMEAQAGFDHIALSLPLETQRWHGGRRLHRSAAPPDVLVVGKQ